ncbi:AAA-like domain-containing protein [Microvirga pakistanensis]|uniref:AAA-like domain-containing protein n=1 Tax=Microvirga pakistanensis TaxID=1682650 RepID=UPI00106DA849|nr:AAA-like domain-containing protein [Microvirga pakistanensis]
MSVAPTSLRLQVGGTLVPSRDLYISRPEDEELYTLLRSGEYVNILSSRQVGKSSLMLRAELRLADEGWSFAVVDLTKLGIATSAEVYFKGLIRAITREMKLELDIEAFWRAHPDETTSQRSISFFSRCRARAVGATCRNLS